MNLDSFRLLASLMGGMMVEVDWNQPSCELFRDEISSCCCCANMDGDIDEEEIGLGLVVGSVVMFVVLNESMEAGARPDSRAVGNEVNRAADQMTRMRILACFFGIRNLMGYMIAKYLSILMATIV